MGALHWTGVGGPVNERMRGPPSAVTGTDVGGAVVGTRIVVVVEDVGVVDVGAAVDGGDVAEGVEGLLDELLHALRTMSRAMVAIGTSRRRRTQ